MPPVPAHDDDLLIAPDASLERGRGVLHADTGVIDLHPLDYLRLVFEGDPIGASQAACLFMTAEVCGELDQMLEDLLAAHAEGVQHA